MSDPVIIIGAGIGGLSAAIHLAAAGREVLVLEQNDSPGGKMGELRDGPFRWDTGPSVITMRHVFGDLFAAAGKRLEDYIRLTPVEPLTRYVFPDGTVLDASRELPRMVEQIRAIDERDVEGYLAYLSYAARLHRITGPTFIYGEPISLRTFGRISPMDGMRIDGFRSMQRAIESHVRSPHLRQMLGRFATYVGASPFLAPATLNVIAHVEMNEGVWYPEGGIYSVARGLTKLAEDLGVEIRTGLRVDAIDVSEGRAHSVRVGGETLPASAVVANVDVATAYERLLPEEHRARLRKLTRAEPSCSGFVMLLGVRGNYPELAHHTIFFSSDYRREFEDVFRRGVPPTDPTVYVAVTSRRSPGDAPHGCENWFVMVNAPALGPQWDWSREAPRYRDRVLNTLAARGLDIRGSIEAEHLLTPADIEQRTGARRGALYGISSNSPLAAFRRPHNRAPDVEGLFFAGGTTHPGGGVPMVMLSGKLAAGYVVEDEG